MNLHDMLEQWPELGDPELPPTEVSALTAIKHSVPAKEEIPLLCINCHWVSMPYSRNPEEARCFVPENYAGINVVDGSKVYRYPLCAEQRDSRNTHPSACGIKGIWWKQRELPPVLEVNIAATIGGKLPTDLELVASNGKAKYKVPKLTRLSKDDLDNL